MSDHKPKVSIIIPCYNNEGFVAEAIESALGQTYQNIEVIVINDGSTDDSKAVINRYRDRLKVIHQENAGACVARNVGIANAKGEWVKFLDSDDLLVGDCVEKQMKKARAREIVIFGDYELIDESGQVSKLPTSVEKSSLMEGALANLDDFWSSLLLTSSTLYPRHVLQRHGGFNPEVRRGQEQELHLRLYFEGVDFEYQPLICFQYRQHDSPSRISVANNRKRYFDEVDNFKKLIRRAEEGPRNGDIKKNQLVLGQVAWRIARRHLRSGARDCAALFFSEALRISGTEAIRGKLFYKFLVRSVDPFFAERLSVGVKTLCVTFKRNGN